jgi:hypothetical protein
MPGRSICCGRFPQETTMRKPFDTEPRLVALTEATLAAQKPSRSWIPQTSTDRVALDTAHWSLRARHENYWRMVEILNHARLH